MHYDSAYEKIQNDNIFVSNVIETPTEAESPYSYRHCMKLRYFPATSK